MNLKQAFRYQTFLRKMSEKASYYLSNEENVMSVWYTHCLHDAKPDLDDKEEDKTSTSAVYYPDDMIRFMQFLIEEKRLVTEAIGAAKSSMDFDLDAAIEVNKYRQKACESIKRMLSNKATKRVTRGEGFVFNDEGNQIRFYYNINIDEYERFNREEDKQILATMMTEADEASAAIDQAMVNTQVEFKPHFDYTMDFDDAMLAFGSL